MDGLMPLRDAGRRLNVDLAVMRSLAKHRALPVLAKGDGRPHGALVSAAAVEAIALLVGIGVPLLAAARIAGAVEVRAVEGGVALARRVEG